jgi:hypothetical protein
MNSMDAISEKFTHPPFSEVVQAANAEAVRRMKRANPVVIGVGKAKDNIPDMRENLILHAGPPITWDEASGAMRGAIIGAMLFEGLANSKEDAIERVEKGEIDIESCHDHRAAAPMAGVITSSMSVFIVEDTTSGSRFYSNISDDLGDFLSSSVRFGVYEDRAIEHLKWIERVLAPALNAAIQDVEYIDFIPIIGRALLMGDNCHVTMDAATPLFLKELMPGLIKYCDDKNDLTRIVSLIHNDSLFALNPVMATCKAIAAAGSDVKHSSIVTVMARNGTEFGIKVSGLGDRWFTGLAEIGQGVLSPGVSQSDVGRDMGDSAITETNGLGGVAKTIFTSRPEATRITLQMYDIAQAESDVFKIPALDGRGAPMGFDIFKIVEKNIRPMINSGLANRHMNRYAAGAGALHPPMEAFVSAAKAFEELEH